MRAEDIKHALRNYNELKEWVEQARNQLEVIQAKMEKTGGSIIKKPEGSFDRSKFMLSAIEKKDLIKSRIGNYLYLKELAEDFMLWLPIEVQDMVVDKYVNGFTGYDLENKYHYSRRWIREVVNRYIDEYIDEYIENM
jgi:predicted metal-dependent hydrolase